MHFLHSHMKLIQINDLSAQDIRSIWNLATKPSTPPKGNVAWSFEGNGIRTRTTFIQAFRELNLSFVELPNLLKTNERVADLAGYLDPFYDIYVIRDSNHERLTEFANASRRPVVNAMSSFGHPCEVLTDAYSIEKKLTCFQVSKFACGVQRPMSSGLGMNWLAFLILNWFTCAVLNFTKLFRMFISVKIMTNQSM